MFDVFLKNFKKVEAGFLVFLFVVINLFFCNINFIFAEDNGADTKRGMNILHNTAKNAGYSVKKSDSDFEQIALQKVGFYIEVFLGAVGAILIIVIIYGGYLWMTAGGKEEQVTQAKKWITNSVIGLIIIGFAYLIAGVLLEITFGG